MKIRVTHLIVAITVIILIPGAWVWLFFEPPSGEACECSISHTFQGSFYINDAGDPKGGFEYAAEYNATLTVTESSGALVLNQISGPGDILTKHLYEVRCLCLEDNILVFGLDGNEVVLIWDLVDPVWDGNYSEHYIASWGSDAPDEARRGHIRASYFPGLLSHYYVELRLK
ncbi:MAG: hypothetical protein ACE5QW_00355 [Thermoplasmata archaeon]